MKRLFPFLCVAISGCAPLEQAPLIYTSTVTFGASTGVNTTETPGFDFSLGYKHVDAAYVPVAVSKKGDKTIEIKEIKAENSDSNNKLTTPSQIQHQEVTKKTDEINDFKKQQEQLTSSIALKQKRQETISSQLQENSIDDETKRSLNAELQTLARDIGIDKKNSEQINYKLLSLEPELKNLKEKLGINDETNGKGLKNDAYSVYGSFDSKTSVFGSTNPKADNGLGKVFSTGVAAQLLAETEKLKASMSSTYTCLKQVESMAATLKIAITEKIILMCEQKHTKKSEI